MTGEFGYQTYLKQVSQIAPGANPIYHQLSSRETTTIGRETNCQLILNSVHFQGVSRQHAQISSIQTSSGKSIWQICDLGSANGTYVNNQKLNGCQNLKGGDRLKLGHSGPEFIFECQSETASVKPDELIPIPSSDDLNLTQLIPILSTRGDLRWKKLMVPGAVTIFFVVLMFNYVGTNPAAFTIVLGLFLAVAGYYVIYQLCGRHKPWWLIVVTVISTIVFNLTLFPLFAFVFRNILPGNITALQAAMNQGQSVTAVEWLIAMFFGAGLLEELTKAIPIFAIHLISLNMRSPQRERIGVWEPLDGILLGAASAVGFTLDETLFQYVPMAIKAGGELAGLQLLIPRILGAIAVHVAYSGYFGYFIGLSALKPRKRWQLLATGYLTAAILHAFWNSAAMFGQNSIMDALLQCIAGVIAYGFLIAAILKARQISPTRAQNFATRFGTTN